MFTYEYPRAALTVDAIVCTAKENKKYLLLIERGNEPFMGQWALPGGFMNMDETLEMACKRELLEETGLNVSELQQFRVYDSIDRDPRHRTISVVFSIELPQMVEARGGDDARQANWFEIDNLPALAFDHRKIVSDFFASSH